MRHASFTLTTLITLTMGLAPTMGCGDDATRDEPVSWRGQAANTLLPDDDDGDVCRLDTGGCADGADDAGDAGDDAPVTDDEEPTPEPEPEPEPEPTPDPDGWPADWATLEDEMLVLVNQFRATGGDCPSGSFGPRPAFRMDPALRTAARLHSEDMAESGYFSHDSQDGRSAWQRMGEAGYTGQPSAENIAAGNRTAAATFEQWRTSDGHCRNMMTQNANEIGIGYAGGGSYGSYWTQTFGAR